MFPSSLKRWRCAKLYQKVEFLLFHRVSWYLECKHSAACPFILNDVVYSSDSQFQSTINLESCIIGSQKSVPPFVVQSRTSLTCFSNWFDHQHHHHAQPIIFELPAPFSDMMCSQNDIPIHPYKLTANFNEGTRIGHKNCGTMCPGTMPLHTLHLLPWIANDGPLCRQLCYPTTSATLYRKIRGMSRK